MYSRLNAATVALVLALPMIASASPAPLAARTEPTYQCSNGSPQCCNKVLTSSQASSAGLLGVLTGLVGNLVGIECTPINVIGLGGNTCTAQMACCNNNNFSGLVPIACNNINVVV